MRKELDEKLCKDFPSIYIDRNGDMRTTAMCWGFDIGDGWFDLIYNLSSTIQSKLNYLNELYKKRNGPKTDEIYALWTSQVKEKYGGLRFYYYTSGPEPHDEEMRDAVTRIFNQIEGIASFTEKLSYSVCEECGDRGRPNKHGWIRTLCAKCRYGEEFMEVYQEEEDES